MLDLSEVTWNDIEIPNTAKNASSNTKETSLSDFLKWDLDSIKLRSDALYLQTIRLSFRYEIFVYISVVQVIVCMHRLGTTYVKGFAYIDLLLQELYFAIIPTKNNS